MAGHVRKRGNKWYYSFEASSVDGKRKRIERVGGRTKKEAEAALRKRLYKILCMRSREILLSGKN